MCRELISEIEARYGFKLPELYYAFHIRGWLDPAQPDLWLELWDTDWWSLTRALQFERESPERPGFIPFASTVNGDRWCWWPEAAHDGGVPIVLCSSNSPMACVYAPHFTGFLYRRILDFACDGYAAAGDERAQELLRVWRLRLVPTLPPEWGATVTKIAERSPARLRGASAEETDPVALLIDSERIAIIKRDLAFLDLNREVRWST